MEATGWEHFVYAHFEAGQLTATVALAYIQEYDVDLHTLLGSCALRLAEKNPSRMKELFALGESVRKEIETFETKREEEDQKIRAHLAQYWLIIPTSEISYIDKKLEKWQDARAVFKEAYSKYKEALKNVEKQFGWEKKPLTVSWEPSYVSEPSAHIYPCITCGVSYIYLVPHTMDTEGIDDDVVYGLPTTICYHCENKMIQAVIDNAKWDAMQDNIRTMRDTIQTFTDAIELDPSHIPDKREMDVKRRKVVKDLK